MDISRYGSTRDRGIRRIIRGLCLKSDKSILIRNKVSWNSQTKQVIISAGHVPHGDGHTNHNYIIQLSLEDISALITVLGDAASGADATLLRNQLDKHVPILVKILACATGLIPIPMSESNK
jgi:hypothetical protein